MANWKYKIEMKKHMDACRNGEITVGELGLKFKKRLEPILKSLKDEDYIDELQEIIWDFENVIDDNDFDSVLERLYDFGDYPLDNKWPPTKMMWVGVAI